MNGRLYLKVNVLYKCPTVAGSTRGGYPVELIGLNFNDSRPLDSGLSFTALQDLEIDGDNDLIQVKCRPSVKVHLD